MKTNAMLRLMTLLCVWQRTMLAVGGSGQAPGGSYFPLPTETKVITLAAGMEVSKIVGESVIQYAEDGGGGNTPNIRTVDFHTGSVMLYTVRFEGATRVRILDVTNTDDGGIVASGYARTKLGKEASFLTKFSAAGRLLATIRTNPYIASSVCSTNDGSVWTIGFDKGPAANSDYRVLRQWNWYKGQTAALLPHSVFPLDGTSYAKSASEFLLSCGERSVYALDGSLRLVAMLRQGQTALELLHPVWPKVDDWRITGCAVSGLSVLYCSAIGANHRHGTFAEYVAALDSQPDHEKIEWRPLFGKPISPEADEVCILGSISGLSGLFYGRGRVQDGQAAQAVISRMPLR